jgi:hypothetical protein
MPPNEAARCSRGQRPTFATHNDAAVVSPNDGLPAVICGQLLLAGDEDLDGGSVGVSHDEMQFAACGLYETLERREHHVASVCETRDLRLIHLQQLGDRRLRQRVRLEADGASPGAR